MPPLFPLMFMLLFAVGGMTGSLVGCSPLAGAVLPAAIATGALFLTDWDFIIDAGAILEFFLPAFLFGLAGALCGWFAGRTVRRLFLRKSA